MRRMSIFYCAKLGTYPVYTDDNRRDSFPRQNIANDEQLAKLRNLGINANHNFMVNGCHFNKKEPILSGWQLPCGMTIAAHSWPLKEKQN